MQTTRSRSSAGMLAALVLYATGASATAIQPFQGKGFQAKVLPTAYLQPRLLDSSSYSEKWEHQFRFQDGTFVYAQFLVTNMAMGAPRGLVIVSLVTPDGTLYSAKTSVKKSGWSYDPERFDIRIKGHRLSGTPPNFELHIAHPNLELDLNFRSTVNAWHPGRIRFDKRDDRYYELTVHAPHLVAEGRYRPGPAMSGKDRGEPWRPLKGGEGFGLHNVNSFAAHKIAINQFRFFPLDTNSHSRVFMMGFTAPDGKYVPWLVVMRDGEVIHTAYQLRQKVITAWEDHAAKGRYRVPTELELVAGNEDFSVSGSIVMKRMVQRFDFLTPFGRLTRFFMQQLSSPVHYRYLAEYDMVLTEGGKSERLQGTGLAEYIGINPTSP